MAEWYRDTDLMSLHDSAALWWFGVATKVLGRDRGVSVGRAEAGRDMGLTSRPGLLNLGSRPHFKVATWLVQSGGGNEVATPL